jgi:hypothetical protein
VGKKLPESGLIRLGMIRVLRLLVAYDRRWGRLERRKGGRRKGVGVAARGGWIGLIDVDADAGVGGGGGKRVSFRL